DDCYELHGGNHERQEQWLDVCCMAGIGGCSRDGQVSEGGRRHPWPRIPGHVLADRWHAYVAPPCSDLEGHQETGGRYGRGVLRGSTV
ncbi:MAG: hypothetical protein AVDCRST_MAG18-2959, partial [uncultured Thermomicrobiales bacterium]